MNHQRPAKPGEQEKVRKETLLRAEYVLPPREPDRQPAKRADESEASDRHLMPLGSLDAATTEATIAHSQFVSRLRSLTHQGPVGIRTIVGKWAPVTLGLAATFVIGLTLLPVAFIGRRRRRGWLASHPSQSLAAPVAMELLKAAAVGVAYWSKLTSDATPVSRASAETTDVIE